MSKLGQALIDALSAGLSEHDKHRRDLLTFLHKLGVKNIPGWSINSMSYGGALSVEALEEALTKVTFDSSHLKLWNKLNNDK